MAPMVVEASALTQIQDGSIKLVRNKQYYDKKRGEYISAEDYWAKKNFKAQPGYIMGKLLRKTDFFSIEQIKETISGIIEYVSSFNIFAAEENVSLFPEKEKYSDILSDSLLQGKKTLIKTMYQENTDFASFCQQEFIELVKKHKKEDGLYSKIVFLIETGAFSIDAYWWAIHYQDEKILSLFSEKSAIKNLIEEQDLFYRFQEMDKGLVHNYKILESIINQGIMFSQKYKKPLMAMLGERHDGYEGSFPNEIMALDILAEKLPNIHFVTEAPLQLCKFRYPQATEDSCKYTFHDFVEKKAKELGLKQTPVDCLFYYDEACKKKDEKACIKKQKMIEEYAPQIPLSVTNEEEKEIRIRNLIMSKMTLQSTEEHAAGIFGAGHIYGFLKETSLPEHFYMLPIETTGFSFSSKISDYSSLYRAFLQEREEVFSVPEIRQIGIVDKEGFEPIPADIIIERARTVHSRAIQTAFNLKMQNRLEDNFDIKQQNNKQCKNREVTDKKIVIDF